MADDIDDRSLPRGQTFAAVCADMEHIHRARRRDDARPTFRPIDARASEYGHSRLTRIVRGFLLFGVVAGLIIGVTVTGGTYMSPRTKVAPQTSARTMPIMTSSPIHIEQRQLKLANATAFQPALSPPQSHRISQSVLPRSNPDIRYRNYEADREKSGTDACNDGCDRETVLAADRSLREAYEDAAQAGVDQMRLASIRDRWVRMRARRFAEPARLIQGYADLTDQLDRSINAIASGQE